MTTTSGIRFAPGHVVQAPAPEIPTAFGPADPSDVTELALTMVRATVERWTEAKRLAKVAEAIDSKPGGNVWSVLANAQAVEAEGQLIAVIRATDPKARELDVHRAQFRRSEPRAVAMDGKLFVIAPVEADDQADDDRETGYWRMRLVVLDVASITSMGE